MTEKERVPNDFVLTLRDYFLTNEEFSLYKNDAFGFLETRPKPIENLSKYYESEAYISHSDSKKTVFEKVYQRVKNHNIRYKFSKLKNTTSGKKLLDYGCGVGDFLLYAKNKKLDVFGIEPNATALKITQKKVGENFASDEKLEETNGEFDFITMWHVLEHIPDLFPFVETLKSKLKDDGTLYVAVPNFKSYDAKFYKKHWAAYDVPRHLWHFSPESIGQLFDRFGMKVEKAHPLWFDSYYVSLLSEKYKKSSFGFFRAMWIASVSNLIGLFNGNYSSVIYQIAKRENKNN